jgi:hypothetical protein
MSEDRVSTIFQEAIHKAIENICKEKLEANIPEDEIIEKLESIDMSEMFTKHLDFMTDSTFDYLKQSMFEEVLYWRAETNEFIAHQEQKWGKCFVASEAMYVIAIESSQAYGQYIHENDINCKDEKQFMFLALREINARTCQIFLEVLYLMKLGFADGAYARWRSMYELSIIAEFIHNNGEAVAEAFFNAVDTEDRYEWAKAAPCFIGTKKKHISFSDIQSQCSFASPEWKTQYDLANKIVHASPQGTFKRLANKESLGVLPVGHSDYGITTPAEHSAITLTRVFTLFITLFPYGDGIMAARVLDKWIDLIREYYFKTRDEVFGDDDFEPIVKTV